MKNGKKKRISIVLMTTIFLSMCTACGKKQEVVITSGEDITEATTQYQTLEASKADKFSYDDLVIGSLRYMMTEDEVKNIMGMPVNSYESQETTENGTNSQFPEHVLSYNDLSLIFMPFDGVYRLTAAASVSSNDTFARGIKVGDKLEDILRLFYRDEGCMNNNYYAPDKTTVLGKYLYGNFTIDDLENVKTKDEINYGVINYSGYHSIESAESYIVEFTSFDSQYKNTTASIGDDFAQLAFDMDNDGVIIGIRWYYYPEEDI